MTFYALVVCVLAAALTVKTASAETPRPLPVSKGATASAAKQYSHFLAENREARVSAATVGSVTVAMFHGGGVCSAGGKCFVTVVTGSPGPLRQILAVRARTIRYIPAGAFPVLVIDGVGYKYVAGRGYIADLKTAGSPFVPHLVPQRETKRAILAALDKAGWQKTVPVVISEVKGLGAAAPVTVAVMPDLTTAEGQGVCASGHCPLALLVPRSHGWRVSAMTLGTGLMAVLRREHRGVHEIGIGQMGGYEAFGWSSHQHRWLPAYTSYKSTISPVP